MSKELKEFRKSTIITTIVLIIVVPIVLYFVIFTDLRIVAESRAFAFVYLGIGIMLGYISYREWKLKKQKKAEQNNE